ncbi:MAG: helix-turn-helix domain-containing protein [Firmicutes bacterium]|nr:helix-turn-helix domain-containing protein [Bacillota bacterium]
MAQSEQVLDFRVLKRTHTGLFEEDKKRFHRFHELFVLTEGSCTVLIGQHMYRMQAGDIALIPARTLHKTDYLDNGLHTKYVISLTKATAAEIDYFLGEELTPLCLKAGMVTIPTQRREAIYLLLDRMLYEYENQPPHAHSVTKACLCELLISILRYRTQEEEKDGIIDERIERIQEVTRYLYDHQAEEITLPQLASHFAVSPSHLSRTFKDVTGFRLREYLIHLRIQRACDLLLSTTLSVTEIADRCGFNDSNYFGDAFRKAIGVSPRDYRKLG